MLDVASRMRDGRGGVAESGLRLTGNIFTQPYARARSVEKDAGSRARVLITRAESETSRHVAPAASPKLAAKYVRGARQRSSLGGGTDG